MKLFDKRTKVERLEEELVKVAQERHDLETKINFKAKIVEQKLAIRRLKYAKLYYISDAFKNMLENIRNRINPKF